MSEEIMNIGSAEGDQVLELDINRLRAFKNHPFKVTADMSMVELKDSIEKYGILNPLIVRPVPEGYYEIISGHRRKFAAKQLGYTKVPVIIKVMKNDEAIVAMVDSNLQRAKRKGKYGCGIMDSTLVVDVTAGVLFCNFMRFVCSCM